MRNSGFTLIELLVVIAIIALLVSILVPSLSTATELARDVVCKNNVHNITVAVSLYTQDHDSYYPYRAWGGVPTSHSLYDAWRGWWARVGIIENGKDRIDRDGYILYARGEYDRGHFKCPTANKQVHPQHRYVGRWDAHYGMSSFIGLRQDRDPPYTVPGIKTEQIRGGALLISDGHMSLNTHGNWYIWEHLQLNKNWDAYHPWPFQTNTPSDFAGHTGNKVMASRVDGSTAAEFAITWHDFLVK